MHPGAYGGGIIAGKYSEPQSRNGNGPCPNSVATLVPILTLAVPFVNRRRNRRHYYMRKFQLLAIKL